MIAYLWLLIQIIIGYNLVLPLVLYIFSTFKRKYNPPIGEGREFDYGIIVTSYEQVYTIPDVVESLLKLEHSNFHIYVVADKCDISGLHFTDGRVTIFRPEETLASNTKSHFYAINRFKRPHECVTIIDSDNLVLPNYLTELDLYFNAGFEAVQGVREAKNLNTTFARLDAARDIYYHFYDGKILFKLGSSATLAGSGMAFKTQLYRDCLENNDVIGAGFDKVLQYRILSRNLRIAFAADAIVFDEKTSKSDQLVKQRSRWINTWFKYFGYGFKLLFKSSRNQFVFGLILLRPPLFIFLLLSLVFMFLNIFISATAVVVWLCAFIAFVLGFYIALAKSETDKRIYQSLVNIPKFIFYQVLSLLKVRKANKHSVATTHYVHSAADKPAENES
ncbi:glycosyltransferase [Mucilaginibacter ginkgonis]|uniref:Glycosyltransferase n=1 Tax=Mucilaginibacter ginkgonis TaxID=2682091 RepID=A0A6I4IP10_9SPHI|nr:glycosyltransferase [Mucilaginibacter ginkgonis]